MILLSTRWKIDRYVQHLARTQEVLVGPSSGAVAYTAQQYCKQLTSTDLAVFILGDSGRAYVTKNFY